MVVVGGFVEMSERRIMLVAEVEYSSSSISSVVLFLDTHRHLLLSGEEYFTLLHFIQIAKL